MKIQLRWRKVLFELCVVEVMDLVPATVVPHAAKDTRQPILIKALVSAFAVLKIFCKIRDDAPYIEVDLIMPFRQSREFYELREEQQ